MGGREGGSDSPPYRVASVHHAARWFALIGAHSAVLCLNWGFRLTFDSVYDRSGGTVKMSIDAPDLVGKVSQPCRRHLGIMDAIFGPLSSISPAFLEILRPHTTLPCHMPCWYTIFMLGPY